MILENKDIYPDWLNRAKKNCPNLVSWHEPKLYPCLATLKDRTNDKGKTEYTTHYTYYDYKWG